MLKRLIIDTIRALGYDLSKMNGENPVWRRNSLMKLAGVNLVLDVGANTGEFARSLRIYGYKDRIVSFEPLSDAFQALKADANRDPSWQAENVAIGNANETKAMNIAGNSVSSSFLAMLPAHLESAPDSGFIGKEEVAVIRLDDVFDDFVAKGERVFLKSDTQGYEKNVLLGAQNVLRRVSLVQLEVSLRPLYEGDMKICEAIEFMSGFSFVPVSVDPGFTDGESGRQLQANVIFLNEG